MSTAASAGITSKHNNACALQRANISSGEDKSLGQKQTCPQGGALGAGAGADAVCERLRCERTRLLGARPRFVRLDYRKLVGNEVL